MFSYASTVSKITTSSSSSAIELSTIERDKLDSSLCTPIDEWYTDNWGTWIDSASDAYKAELINAMECFYDDTGVQPYLYITGEEGEDLYDESDVEDFAEDVYYELFDDDEGHLLVVFCEYPDESGNYIVTATPGLDAETVMDEEAREILLDYIDYYYEDESLSDTEFFACAFKDSADRIMTVTEEDETSSSDEAKTKKAMSVIFILPMAVLAIIIISMISSIFKSIRSNANKNTQSDSTPTSTATPSSAASAPSTTATTNTTPFKPTATPDTASTTAPSASKIAVTCPNCGASTYVNKGSANRCDFCGGPINVDILGYVVSAKAQTEDTAAENNTTSLLDNLGDVNYDIPDGKDTGNNYDDWGNV